MYIVAYQQFVMAPIFSFVKYRLDGLSTFASYLKLVLLPYVKSGSRLLPLFKKQLCFDDLLIIHEGLHTSTAPSAFPAGGVSRKLWFTLITTQQEGIYPKNSLRFVTYHVNSPTPTYWHIALCVYSPGANILALHVLGVNDKLQSIHHLTVC